MVFWKSISNRNERKIEEFMNKAVYLDFSILEISKITMDTNFYISIKSYHVNNVPLHCIDIDSFIIYLKTKDLSEY